MKIHLLLITSILLLFSSCKTQQSTKSNTQENPLNKFINNIVGLKKGDTIEKVFELYGEPTEHRIHEDKYDFNTVYYYVEGKDRSEWALSVSYEKDTHKISSSDVESAAAALLKQKKIKDKIYIKMHADKIRKIFGPKEYGHVNQLQYEEDGFEIVFYCYDFRDYKCSNYIIYWWY